MPGPGWGDGEESILGGGEKGLELKERRTASPRMCLALHSLPRLVCGDCSHRVLSLTPILRMKLGIIRELIGMLLPRGICGG